MKKSIIAISAALLLTAAGAAVFFVSRPSDERKIRKMLDELCEIGSKSSGENQALAAFKANRSDDVFAPECSFNFRKVGVFDGKMNPTEIGSRILRTQAIFQWIKLNYSELELTKTNDNEYRLFFSGSFEGTPKNKSSKISELRDVDAVVNRQPDGTWKISSMTFREILEK